MEKDDIILIMAALIASVRTARFDEKLFQGMSTPAVTSQISASIWMAEKLYARLADKRESEAWNGTRTA